MTARRQKRGQCHEPSDTPTGTSQQSKGKQTEDRRGSQEENQGCVLAHGMR